MALTLVLVPAGTAQAKKPLRYGCAGEKTPYGWIYTFTSGDLEGYTGIAVTLVADFKGARVHFFEIWFIGYGIDYVDGEVTGDVVLAGFDEGATRLKNGEFTGNGRVTEGYDDANGDWSDLIGCKEHVSGTVDFVDPLDPMTWTFTGTVQIN